MVHLEHDSCPHERYTRGPRYCEGNKIVNIPIFFAAYDFQYLSVRISKPLVAIPLPLFLSLPLCSKLIVWALTCDWISWMNGEVLFWNGGLSEYFSCNVCLFVRCHWLPRSSKFLFHQQTMAFIYHPSPGVYSYDIFRQYGQTFIEVCASACASARPCFSCDFYTYCSLCKQMPLVMVIFNTMR